jgi:3-phosphoglycerate kinase
MVGKVWTQVQNHWSSSKVIMDSKTILWNGPLGVFEMEILHGTIALGNFIAESTANGAFSLVGGGDSVAAVKQFGLEDKMSYVYGWWCHAGNAGRTHRELLLF